MKKYFESIIWPNKARVKTEFLIVAIGTIIIGLFTFGIDALAKFILNSLF